MKKMIMLCAIASTLSACGGGSDESQSLSLCTQQTLDQCGGSNHGFPPTVVTPASPGAEGLYNGTTSSGRTFAGLILDDGSYYVIYTAQNNPLLIAGAGVGTGTSSNGTFSSTNGKDINLEGLGLLSATVSATYTEKASFKGSTTYPSLNQTITFSGTYNTAYEATPTLATIAGTYSGRAGSSHGTEAATIAVSDTGDLSGIGSSGCTSTGSIMPRAKGNAYIVTTTFGGSPCLLPNTTVTGAAYYDSPNKRLYAVGLTAAKTDGFIFAGSKP